MTGRPASQYLVSLFGPLIISINLHPPSARFRRWPWPAWTIASVGTNCLVTWSKLNVGVVVESFLHRRCPEKKRIGCATTNKKESNAAPMRAVRVNSALASITDNDGW